jgi:hypothetical protein
MNDDDTLPLDGLPQLLHDLAEVCRTGRLMYRALALWARRAWTWWWSRDDRPARGPAKRKPRSGASKRVRRKRRRGEQ